MRNDEVVQETDELREHYSFDYNKAKPNRFANRFSGETIVVVLDPDVAAVFTTYVGQGVPTKRVSPTRTKISRRGAGLL